MNMKKDAEKDVIAATILDGACRTVLTNSIGNNGRT